MTPFEYGLLLRTIKPSLLFVQRIKKKKKKKNDQQKNWQVTLQALRASGFHYLPLIFYLTRKWGGNHKEMRVSEHCGGMKIIEHLRALWKKCPY